MPPLLAIHGTRDTVVSSKNARAAVRAWADAAAASATAARALRRGGRHPMSVTDFRSGCRLVATLVEVDGLGHAWSGGSKAAPFGDPRGPDASRMIWAFAARRFALNASNDARPTAP